MVMDIAAARLEIQTMVRFADFPVLDTTYDIPLLVRKAKRQDINRNVPDPYEKWIASTAYLVGATVVADPRNNSYFTATVAGTSDTVQPTWPTITGATVVDAGVTWSLTGAANWRPTWNLAYGISQGWKMKMSKLVAAYDIKVGGQSLSRSQMFEMCKEMQRQWSRRASMWDQVFLMGSLRDRRLFQNITNQNDELFIDGQIQWGLLDEYYAQRGFTGVSPGGQWIDP